MTSRAPVCLCLLTLCLASCGSSQTNTTSGTSTESRTVAGAEPAAGESPDKLATDAAYAFLDTYTTDVGRIQRTDQGGDSTGEGQAYGLLAAAAVGDQRRFDRIWSWTTDNMVQSNGLLAFHWVDGRIVDPHPAADADLDAARALLLASCRFSRADLRTAAIKIGDAVLARQTARAGSVDVLLAGPWANMGSHLVFNPSYVDPTHWAIVNTATGKVTPVSAASSISGPGTFTYDAPRTLIRFAVDRDPAGRSAVARAWGVFQNTRPADIVTEHELSGAPAGSGHAAITLVAAAGAAQAAGDSGVVPKLLAEAQQRSAQHPTYYGTAWLALGRLLLTTDRLRPCGT